ncbi:hypothetical protein ACFVTP_09910 [Streptomyces celluloflavus]|uniref:hypothetical protein n=1 Tax=Streptomyces celluloflavus TaxID=58344 RepID=UPI0036DECAE9
MRATALNLSAATAAGLLVWSLPVAASATAPKGPAPRTVKVKGKLDGLTARCPAGYHASGGGFEIPGYEMEQAVTASRPTTDGTGWVVSASSVNPAMLHQLEVIQDRQDALDKVMGDKTATDAQRQAAQKALDEAQKTAYDMPQRAALTGTAYALCTK